jgi:predicted nucleotidyltransferase
VTTDQRRSPPFVAVLEESITILNNARIPYVVGGGLAARAYGRRRMTKDIDIFVHRDNADRAIRALADAGFRTERTNPDWLYKAFKQDILVDIIFRSSGDIYIDPETIRRAGEVSVGGYRIRVLPPEDLLVMKIMTISPDTPRHWRDAMAVLRGARIDWPYLLRKAQIGPKRVLGILLFAQTEGVDVPDWVIQQLSDKLICKAAS